jgi:rSAM/selenodomain-associated transferase 1
MATADNALAIMTKAPKPGESKTRLVPPLSFEEAAELARALLLDQLDNLSKFMGARLFIAFTPEESAGFFQRFVTQGYSAFPQQGNSLGERMRYVFQHLFDRGFRNVVLIGSDLPVLPVAFLDQAYVLLEKGETDLILGPTRDGGYYLIGMSRLISSIFEGITWSRSDVLSRTTEKLAGLGLKHELLSFWYDIDTAEDLQRLRSEPNCRVDVMKHTLALLNELTRAGRL